MPIRLPRAEDALVDETKVRDYLMSADHPVGRFKARVFASVGYHRDDWPRLRDDLKALAERIDVVLVRAARFGYRYAGPGHLAGPNGSLLPIVSVWLIPSPGEPPRLITAYPGSVP